MKLGKILLAFVPLGLLKLGYRIALPRMHRKAQRRSEELLAAWQDESSNSFSEAPTTKELIAMLGSWDLDLLTIHAGSIPEEDLVAICGHLQEKCPAPILGIHVGNFLGVSLGYVASRLNRWDPQNVVISIDPNLTHRGIPRTELVVTRLLKALNVQDTVIRVTGYSLARAVGNDGLTIGDHDPFESFSEDISAENQLRNLTKVHAGKVDFIMLDGNHDAAYLHEEVDVCSQLLRPGGILFLDDIGGVWAGLTEEFDRLAKLETFTAERIGTRTGMLIKR